MSLFIKGLPTDLDVKALRERFPDASLTKGQRIEYDEISRVCQIALGSSRFTSVCNAWRKKLERESGIILKAMAGQKHFIVCDDADKADLSVKKTDTAVKTIKRGVEISKSIDRSNLTEDQLKRLDCKLNFASMVIGLKQLKQQPALPTI